MEILAGELVARVLKGEGVSTVFGLCGGHVVPILHGLGAQGIRFIDTHHEQASVHMADAWARVTGGLGVALVTAGPGVANAVPGVITAQQAGVPLLLLAGRSSEGGQDMGEGQELDR